MQFPALEGRRIKMFKEMSDVCPEIDQRMTDNPGKLLYWLIGGLIDDIEGESLIKIWTIAGQNLNEMYREIVKDRKESVR